MSNPIDDLLRETLQRPTETAPPTPCLDADTAAAFSEDALMADDRARAEEHLADCARCQELLAALARTSPTPPPARWRRPAFVWLAPLTAAATAAIVWVGVWREPDIESMSDFAREAVRPAENSATATLADDGVQAARDSAGSPTPSGTARRERDPAREMVLPSPSGRSYAKRENTPSNNPGARAEHQVKQRAVGAPAPVPRSAPVEAPPQAVMPTAATVQTAEVRAELAQALALAAAMRADNPIISSSGASWWRIGGEGVVQHSSDNGVTWQTQSIGVNAAPIVGSSPSPLVCWLVGRAGLILITTDQGRSWQRVAFPFSIDLISVRATDDQSATVVTTDGRTFRTSDRGRNWR